MSSSRTDGRQQLEVGDRLLECRDPGLQEVRQLLDEEGDLLDRAAARVIRMTRTRPTTTPT